MTHSLHRRGPREQLEKDYVVLTNSSRVNRDWTKPLLPKVARIVFEIGPTNVGSSTLRTNVPLGIDQEEFVKHIHEAHVILSCWSSKEKLREMLRRLKEADMGISVTVSGLIDEVIPMAQELGIKPHTINLSMGILGKTEKLADEDLLQFTTMCGHALIATNLVKKGLQDVRCGAKTAREASNMIAEPCVCGIYNLERSDDLLQLLAAQE